MPIDAQYHGESEAIGDVVPGTALVVQLARAELDAAVTTAKAYPRSVDRAMKAILTLATLDPETAKECVYALPRAGKPITGPSVRLAEIIASQWGNCKVGARVVAVDRVEKVVIAEGIFYDLETGMTRVQQTQRRISDKNGKIFNDDMIAVTGNAACSIAMREAVLKGVPKAIWRRAYEAAELVIKGDVKTIKERRDAMVKAFAAFGVVPDQIFACLEVGGLDDINLDEIGMLTAIFLAIKDGEAKVEDYFPAVTNAKAAVEAARGTARKMQEQAAPAEVVEHQPSEPAAKIDKVPPKPRATKAAEPAKVEAKPKAEVQPAEEAVNDLFAGKDDPDRSDGSENEVEDAEGVDQETGEVGEDWSKHKISRQFVEDLDVMGSDAVEDLYKYDMENILRDRPGQHAYLLEVLRAAKEQEE
jgi:hypothetical protein